MGCFRPCTVIWKAVVEWGMIWVWSCINLYHSQCSIIWNISQPYAFSLYKCWQVLVCSCCIIVYMNIIVFNVISSFFCNCWSSYELYQAWKTYMLLSWRTILVLENWKWINLVIWFQLGREPDSRGLGWETDKRKWNGINMHFGSSWHQHFPSFSPLGSCNETVTTR